VLKELNIGGKVKLGGKIICKGRRENGSKAGVGKRGHPPPNQPQTQQPISGREILTKSSMFEKGERRTQDSKKNNDNLGRGRKGTGTGVQRIINNDKAWDSVVHVGRRQEKGESRQKQQEREVVQCKKKKSRTTRKERERGSMVEVLRGKHYKNGRKRRPN